MTEVIDMLPADAVVQEVQPPAPMGAAGALVATTPGALLDLAVRSGASLDQLERLMQLKERFDAGEARKAFARDFAAFKSEAVTILKSKKITDGPLKGKTHALLSDVVKATAPALSQHGLSISWKLTKDERDWMEVTCTLSHVGGHTEVVAMGGPPDTGPGRNAMQARGSTKTYLERYTATAIMGLAAEDADDDGAGGKDEGPSEVDRWIALAQRTKTEAELNNVVAEGVNAFARDKRSYAQFREAVTAHRLTLKEKTRA